MLTTLIPLLVLIPLSNAFSFNLTTLPTQCENLTVQWADGTAPYHLLIVPTGHLHPEIRVISDFTIDSGTSFSFPLQYPGNTSIVAVMSDATGFGSGGTTTATSVASSKDKACLRKSEVSPEFLIFTDPPTPQQCAPMNISYNADAIPPVDVFAVILGGAGGPSSRIESGSPQNRTFTWTPTLPVGTELLIVAGDTMGAGKGGSTDVLIMGPGNSTECLSTPSTPNTTTTSPPPSATPSSGAASGLSWSISAITFGLLFFLVK